MSARYRIDVLAKAIETLHNINDGEFAEGPHDTEFVRPPALRRVAEPQNPIIWRVDAVDQYISAVGQRAQVDHIGLAVPNIATALALYRNLPGVEIGEPRELRDQGLIVAFAAFANLRVEFLSPTQKMSPLVHLLEDRTINDFLAAFPRGGAHHICLVVDGLDTATSALVAAGGRVLGRGDPVIGADGRPIVFVDPGAASDLLIELKENAPS